MDDRRLPKSGVVNGVFKGGGAKGVAYAGALQAVEKAELTFGAVAGTSAGAITATLVAAGYSAADITGMVPDLLKKVKCGLHKTVVGILDGLYDNRRLGDALEQLLRDRIGGPQSGTPVTFAELYENSPIRLYVVALDLATSTPIVFSDLTTPQVSVTSAVMASSAIPGGFPSARAVWRVSDGFVAHRLVDGGAWANFPRFVFQDESFVKWLETSSETDLREQSGRPTLLFALANERPSTQQRPHWVEHRAVGPQGFDQGTLQSYRNPVAWIFGTLMSSAITRILFAASLVGIAVAAGLGLRREFRYLWSAFTDDTTGLTSLPLSVAATFTVLAAVVVGLILLVSLGLSKILGGTLIPAAKSALAVGTGVAPWVGSAEDDYLILVPYGDLSTNKFRVKPTVLESVVDRSRETTAEQLAAYRASTPPDGQSNQTVPSVNLPTGWSWGMSLASAVFLVVSLTLVTDGILEASSGAWSVVWILTSVVVGAGWLWLGAKAAAEFHHRVSTGRSSRLVKGMGGRWLTLGISLTGLLVVGAGVLWSSSEQRQWSTWHVPVVVSEVKSAGEATGEEMNVYTFLPRDPADTRFAKGVEVESAEQLLVGDEVDLGLRSDGVSATADFGNGFTQLGPRAAQVLGIFFIMVGNWMWEVRRRERSLMRSIAQAG